MRTKFALYVLILASLFSNDAAIAARVVTVIPEFIPGLSEENAPIERVTVLIAGEFKAGTAAELERHITSLNNQGIRVVDLELVSQGGLVSEGMAIGRLARRLKLTTKAPLVIVDQDENYLYSLCSNLKLSDDERFFVDRGYMRIDPPETFCQCSSACALAWLGGVMRSGTVGFHRSTWGGNVDDLNYSDFEQAIGSSLYKIDLYLKEMRAPGWLSDEIFKTSSQEVTLINYSDPRGGLNYEPIFHEFIVRKCGIPLTDAQSRRLYDLVAKRDGGSLSRRETVEMEPLYEQDRTFSRCLVAELEQTQLNAQLR